MGLPAIKKYSESQNMDLTASDFRIILLPSRSFQRGGSRSSRYVERDAVDVEAPLTNGAEADGQVVWSRRLEVGVKPAEFFPPVTVSTNPDHRGEHEATVNHCAGNVG
jgi:hypothetical protein